MPCNGDYLAPTIAEKAEQKSVLLELKAIVDDLVASNDVLSEFVLTRGNSTLGNDIIRAVFRGNDALYRALALMNSKNWGRLYTGQAEVDKFAKLVNKLGDKHRYLAEYARNPQNVTDEEYQEVEADQIEHRKLDIRRCVASLGTRLVTLADESFLDGDAINEVTGKLTLLAQADPNAPLLPQLGFDPDTL